MLEQLDREPLAADEWLDGAITWYHCRRLDQAVQWARAGAAKEGNPAGRAVLARCLIATGQPEASLRVLSDHALTLSPSYSLIHFWRARAQVRCGDAVLRRSGRERLARLAAEAGDAAAAFEAGRAFLQAA